MRGARPRRVEPHRPCLPDVRPRQAVAMVRIDGSDTPSRQIVAGAALISRLASPRGPITTAQALGSMVGAVAVGVAAGFVTGSRWSIVLAPVTFMAVYEVARLGVNRPTVDQIRLGSIYGVFAFVLGHKLTGLLVLAPMALGGRYGVETASRLGREGTPRLRLGWLPTGVLTLALGASPSGSRCRPPPRRSWACTGGRWRTASRSSDDPARRPGPDRDDPRPERREPGSCSTSRAAPAEPTSGRCGRTSASRGLRGGHVGPARQRQVVRRSRPARHDQRGPGGGRHHRADEPAAGEFDEDRIYLVGNSWGTILGTIVAQQEPELFHAYVGTGQMVSQRETDRMFYEDTLAWARATGDTDLVAKLEAQGPPPYADIRGYETAQSRARLERVSGAGRWTRRCRATCSSPRTPAGPAQRPRCSSTPSRSLYPQLQEIDFRADVPSLDVPVYLVLGAHEARGRAVLAEEWFEELDAPAKTRIEFAHSGHRPLFEEPAEFVA